jgi:acyl-CoA reductase-like NAD-dependent aldehyde dehydrogenase
VGGKWRRAQAGEFLDVRNPATAETIVRVPLSSAEEVDEAVHAAQTAFADWRRTPPTERIQYLFKFKKLLEDHYDEIARLTTQECGKTLAESQGELQRGIENVEVASGIPSLMMGYNVEDIARGIDEHMFRQPVGVVAAITPFNFPSMIPLWFLPYAIACGNCFILKPSEKVPMTMSRVFDLIDQLGLPPGVVSLVNGAKGTVDRRQWQSTSTAGRQATGNVPSVRAERRTRSSSCLTLIWRWPPASSPTRPLGAPVSAAWRHRWRSRLARRAMFSENRSEKWRLHVRSAMGLIQRLKWGRSSHLKVNNASNR